MRLHDRLYPLDLLRQRLAEALRQIQRPCDQVAALARLVEAFLRREYRLNLQHGADVRQIRLRRRPGRELGSRREVQRLQQLPDRLFQRLRDVLLVRVLLEIRRQPLRQLLDLPPLHADVVALLAAFAVLLQPLFAALALLAQLPLEFRRVAALLLRGAAQPLDDVVALPRHHVAQRLELLQPQQPLVLLADQRGVLLRRDLRPPDLVRLEHGLSAAVVGELLLALSQLSLIKGHLCGLLPVVRENGPLPLVLRHALQRVRQNLPVAHALLPRLVFQPFLSCSIIAFHSGFTQRSGSCSLS